MKRFTFPLERLLRLRHQETEQSKLNLAGAIQRQAEAETRLRQAMTLLADRTDQALAKRVVSAADFALVRRHVDYLQGQADHAEAEAARAAADTDESRRLVVESRQKEQVLAKLRDRRYEQYQMEVGREEQKFLDEITHAVGPLQGTGRREVDT